MATIKTYDRCNKEIETITEPLSEAFFEDAFNTQWGTKESEFLKPELCEQCGRIYYLMVLKFNKDVKNFIGTNL